MALNFPTVVMSPDWVLTRLRLFQEEQFQVGAYFYAKRLLPVITDNARSELLFRLTELAFAQGTMTWVINVVGTFKEIPL